MIPRSRLLRYPPSGAAFSARWFASSTAHQGGIIARAPRIRTILSHDTIQTSSQSPLVSLASAIRTPLLTNSLRYNTFSTTSRASAISFRDLKGEGEGKAKSAPKPASTDRSPADSTAGETASAKAPSPDPSDPAEQAYQAAKREGDKERAKARARADRARAKEEAKEEAKEKADEEASGDGKEETEGGGKRQEKKEEEAPPPPHGNKSPWQVFTDTLKTEFQASKEWNEGTKQLSDSAHQFTENESVKRARAAYSAASGAATSGTATAIKGAAKSVGQGAAWTWDTTVVKGVRQGVSATGRAIDTATKPVRETEAFKSVKNVIDDGSSSRYGGWVEKEERKKQRELRELQEAAASGRPGRRVEKMEEDPEYAFSSPKRY